MLSCGSHESCLCKRGENPDFPGDKDQMLYKCFSMLAEDDESADEDIFAPQLHIGTEPMSYCVATWALS